MSLGAVPDADEMSIAGGWLPGRQLRTHRRGTSQAVIPVVWVTDKPIETAARHRRRQRVLLSAAEARQKGQALVLDVLTVNHRAQALYQRLGMTEVARHGDSNIKITMRLTP